MECILNEATLNTEYNEKLFQDFEYDMVFFRGPETYILRLSEKCKIEGIEIYGESPHCVTEEIFEIEIRSGMKTGSIIKEFPILKVTGFILDRSDNLGSIDVFYSESGYPYITERKSVQGLIDMFVREDKWWEEHSVLDDFKGEFIDIKTGAIDYLNYKFPFSEYHDTKYAFYENGQLHRCFDNQYEIENRREGKVLKKVYYADGLFEVPPGIVEIQHDAFYAMIGRIHKLIALSSMRRCPHLLYATWLEKIELNSNITSIDAKAFLGCTYLKEITIPRKTIRIYRNAFKDCINLEKVEFCDSSKVTIDTDAFVNCHALKTIRLPKDCREVKYSSFVNCSQLSEVHVCSKTKVETDAFVNCSRDLKVIIYEVEKDSTDLGLDLFDADNNRVIVDENVINKEAKIIELPIETCRIGNGVFKGYKKTEAVILNEKLAEMGKECFMNCKSLKRIHIPGSVKVIGNRAFEGCVELEEVIIDKGCVRIGSKAFSKCPNLMNVYIPNTVEDLGRDMFNDSKNVIVHGGDDYKVWAKNIGVGFILIEQNNK